MKARVYTRFLNVTSVVLNLCVKKQWWGIAKPLIEFRKKHIVTTLRSELSRY